MSLKKQDVPFEPAESGTHACSYSRQFFVIFMIILLSSGIISTQPLFTDSYKDSLHEEIMQRLVAFCNSQLSKSAPEPVKNQNNTR